MCVCSGNTVYVGEEILLLVYTHPSLHLLFLSLSSPPPLDADSTTEFYIHSLDGKVWYFDAGSPEEMSDWVKAIEGQIKKILEESLLPKRNVSLKLLYLCVEL